MISMKAERGQHVFLSKASFQQTGALYGPRKPWGLRAGHSGLSVLCLVWDLGFRVWGLGCGVWGLGFRAGAPMTCLHSLLLRAP